jgi:alkylhydroperoxidase/carboxymuconolactone decarboxylase family protein YurZ
MVDAGENELLHLPLLRARAPKTLGGYGLFRSVIDSDGALPARIKALFVSVAAATRGYELLARRELARARNIGLTFDEAAAAVAILSSVRGEGAALRFNGILDSEFPGAALKEPAQPRAEAAPGEAKANFLAYFGEIPPALGTLLELVPVAADAYYLMRQGTLSGTPLGQKFAELMLVTVLVADYSNWAGVHIKGARTAGASEHEIAEAILCAVPASGLSAWVIGAAAMAS